MMSISALFPPTITMHLLAGCQNVACHLQDLAIVSKEVANHPSNSLTCLNKKRVAKPALMCERPVNESPRPGVG
ncbi:hypothetical protein DFJ77DRAFT_467244 [Powellomyces hirtus]|nr:hypothetical protein DFJ77DRAFT_467244 [Powellomyces hirtus]